MEQEYYKMEMIKPLLCTKIAIICTKTSELDSSRMLCYLMYSWMVSLLILRDYSLCKLWYKKCVGSIINYLIEQHTRMIDQYNTTGVVW